MFCGIDAIIRPVVTEKSAILERNNLYTFLVHDLATKHDIARGLQLIYGMNVTSVNTIRTKYKVKRRGRGFINKKVITSRMAKWKKAVVSFGGEKIDVSIISM